jgi:hypothetical protein
MCIILMLTIIHVIAPFTKKETKGMNRERDEVTG